MMNVKNLFLAVYLFSNCPLFGQNLVLNPSFEQGSGCDGSTENIESSEHWAAVAGKPRFMNLGCSLSKDTKTYLQGMQLAPAFEGNVFAGLGIDAEGEFIQGTLSKPLEANKVYWVKLRLRMPTRFCNAPIQELGIAFSDKKTEATEKYRKLDMPALKLQNNDKSAFSAPLAWKEVYGFYTAKGGETQLVIGNFVGQNADLFAKRKKGDCTYLYLDLVSVEEYKEIELPVFETTTTPIANQRMLLKDIIFDGTRINKGGFRGVDKLYDFMVKNPNSVVEISVHTDNEQEEYTNKTLSKEQAESIINNLTGRGIKKDRLQGIGKGSSQNLVPNDTFANRTKNQRVEIQFIKL